MLKTCRKQFERLVTTSLSADEEMEARLPSFSQLKSEVFDALAKPGLMEGRDRFRSRVMETATANGTRQLFYNRLTRDKRQFLIEEAVVNFLGEAGVLPYAFLQITDLRSGQSLAPDRLLPPGCAFTPSRLLKVRIEFDSSQRRMSSEFFPVNLKTYAGAGSEGDFYFNREAGRVAYGNLAAPGALLSLFHEIAHAWQFAAEGKSAKKDFNTLFSYLSLRLHNLGVRMEAFKSQAISEERYHYFIDMAREKLAEKGIELDTESVINGNPSPSAGSHVFTAHSGKRFFFRSRTFALALDAYIQAERDAWAHAILILRLLRRMGLDLDPGLRQLKDFRNHIHPFLENYRNSINSQLEINGGHLLRRDKKTRAANPRLTSQLI